MINLRIILNDQLSQKISSLEGCDKENDIILLCELYEEATYVKHHKKKIAFLLAAMRHFVQEMRESGYRVTHIKIDDPNNSGILREEVKKILRYIPKIKKIIVTHPGEMRILDDIASWQDDIFIPVEIRNDNRFLCSLDDFAVWANSRKLLRMEYFYRYMRQKHGVLMENGQPIGGKWNYDAVNRKPPKRSSMTIPASSMYPPDDITRKVMRIIEERFSDHFGDLEPFYFAVNRAQALEVMQFFIAERLKNFGTYQDAMLENEPWMYHSHLSFYLNAGLLLPLECIEAAVEAYYAGSVPLNAVEGFIRQILGWREYVRGVYWLRMPEYKSLNFLGANRKLPDFYWTANTSMNCMKQCISQTQKYAYAHHIQRLMVLGNFALLAGIDPNEVNEWYLIVYADAFEWVELPNVTGMVLFADAGYLASKPYAGSGKYINKMSDYCDKCHYRVQDRVGEQACPFNYLYWNFLAVNRKSISDNPRMGLVYKAYDRLTTRDKESIEKQSADFLAKM